MGHQSREILNLEAGEAPEIVAGELRGDLRLRAGEADRIEAAGEEIIRLERGEDGRVHLEARGDVSLRVPAGCRLNLPTLRGDGRIHGLRGGLSMDEVSGDLRLRDLGPVTLGAVYGDLAASQIEGSLSVDNVYGDARISGLSGDARLGSVGADLSLSGVEGRIAVEVGADANVDLTAIEAAHCQLRAGADIHLRLGQQANLRLDAESGAGHIELRMTDVEAVEREESQDRVSLSFGEGEGQVHLEAGGSLRIDVGNAENWTGAAQWAEMGEDFRKMAEQFSQRMEQQMSTMSEALGERLGHLSDSLPEVLTAAGLSLDEAERIAIKVRRAGERAGEKAQRRVERAMKRAETRLSHAEKRRHGRHGSRHARRWVYMPERGADEPEREPVSTEERMTVLRMLEAGRISAAEAERLLAAMEGREADHEQASWAPPSVWKRPRDRGPARMLSAAERKRILAMIESGRISPEEGMALLESLRQAPGGEAAASPARSARRLRFRVTDAATGQVVASARLPLGALRLLQQAIGRFVPDLDLLDLSDWLDQAEDGEGRILDMLEREDGQRIEIFVE